MNIQAVSNAFQPMVPAVESHKPASVPLTEAQSMVSQVKSANQAEVAEKQTENKKSNAGEQDKSSFNTDDLFTETQLKISTSEEGVITIKIIDSKTNEVINEIPPEKLAKILSAIRKLSGLIFDQQA